MDAIRSLQDACIAATGLALAFRLPPLFRTPREVTAATLVRGLACLEAIFLVGHPDLYGIVYRALGGVPALPQFLQHLAALLLAYQARIFMIQVTGSAPPGRRAERRRLAAWAVALTACYALGPLRAGLPMLDPHGSADGGVVAYVVLWQSALAVVLVDAVRRGLRHAVTGGTGLRIGLRLLLAGYVLALVNVLHKTGYTLAAYLDVRLPWLESGTGGVQLYLLAPTLGCLLTGLVLPALWARAVSHRALRRAYRQLAPLADALCPPGTCAPAGRGAQARLRSRIVDVRDTLIGPMRAYLDPGVWAAAYARAGEAGLGEEDARAIAEAACIAAAIRRRDGGQPVPDPEPVPLAAPADWDGELAWLLRVGRAYARDRLVKEIAAGSGL